MQKTHSYHLNLEWKGNKGQGTSGYRSYSREHLITANNKPSLHLSSDPAFLGDPGLYNPEELLLASISGCHMLWFLHLCADAGIIVTAYTDQPEGMLVETKEGGGYFSEVTLNPLVTITQTSMAEKLDALHNIAHKRCFIANSVNFPVHLIGNYLISKQD